MNILKLTLKKKWFDLILCGEKKYEYRDIKPYFFNRLMLCENDTDLQVMDEIISDLKNVNQRHNGLQELLDYFKIKFRHYDFVEFKNGYAKDAPRMIVEFCGAGIGRGISEHGAPVGEDVFMISLGKIIETENINA